MIFKMAKNKRATGNIGCPYMKTDYKISNGTLKLIKKDLPGFNA